MINILVVDDHPVVREGLSAMLSTQPDMEVVAEAANGAEALELAMRHRPDVIVLDLQLPDMDGSEVIGAVKREWAEARVLVLTSFDTDDRVLRAVRAGAQGYLLKGTPKDELFYAVRTINQGGSLLGPGIAPKLLGQVYDQADRESRAASTLSAREMSILVLVANGLRNKEIASQLCISDRTVKFHVNSIFQKLGASSRTEAVKNAVQQGLIRI
ncbi:MAG: response regulator transcription factor [SAR202 cluster bacterium]|nr:response regulator transcription factor [SAR202 cluster bacterium]